MGLIGDFFGFDGRIGRLAYLCSMAAVAGLVFCLDRLGVMAAGFVPLGSALSSGDVAHDARVAAEVIGLWCASALTIRRVRDMGLEPAYVAPGCAALWIVDVQLLQPLSLTDPARYESAATVLIVLACLAGLAVVVWPSRDRDRTRRREPAIFEPPAHTAYLDWRRSG